MGISSNFETGRAGQSVGFVVFGVEFVVDLNCGGLLADAYRSAVAQ